MTNRELLELAAKAAGYDAAIEMYGFNEFGDPLLDRNDPPTVWNPLESDGDALRLAAMLGIDLLFTTEHVEAFATPPTGQEDEQRIYDSFFESWTLKPQDPCTATRRAIVRAAAEIGKDMK
jgi:hypothetical protein